MFKNRLGISIAALSAMIAIHPAAQEAPRSVGRKFGSPKDKNSLGDVGGNRLSQKGIRRRARQAGVKVSKWKS